MSGREYIASLPDATEHYKLIVSAAGNDGDKRGRSPSAAMGNVPHEQLRPVEGGAELDHLLTLATGMQEMARTSHACLARAEVRLTHELCNPTVEASSLRLKVLQLSPVLLRCSAECLAAEVSKKVLAVEASMTKQRQTCATEESTVETERSEK